MAWFKRDYGTASYEREQQHFTRLFAELGGPKGMMMVRTGGETKCTVYIALTPFLAARNFPEFEPTEMPPPDSTWLFGHEADGERFRSGPATHPASG